MCKCRARSESIAAGGGRESHRRPALSRHAGKGIPWRFLHGYSAGEIGRELGLTPDHVRVLQLRALRRAATHVDLEPDAPHDVGAQRGL